MQGSYRVPHQANTNGGESSPLGPRIAHIANEGAVINTHVFYLCSQLCPQPVYMGRVCPQPLRRGAEQGKEGDDEEELLTENI